MMKGKALASFIIVALIPVAIGTFTGVRTVNELVSSGDVAGFNSSELAWLYVLASLSYSIVPYLILLGIAFIALIVALVLMLREENSEPINGKND